MTHDDDLEPEPDDADGGSDGYDAVAAEYVGARSRTIGVAQVLEWARQLAPGAAVLDIGCGHGEPISAALVKAGYAVHGVDASPRLVEEFRARLPGVPVTCEPIERSSLHGRSFEGAIAWGVIFLLDARGQRRLIDMAAHALTRRGRLLFTAPWQAGTWTDALTARASRSLGRDEYRRMLDEAGLELVGEDADEGENHYYSAVKP